MIHIARQRGSSTFGLIIYSGLYAGLLIYATQYAFVKNPDPSITTTGLETQIPKPIQSITPTLKGGIQSKTITKDHLTNSQVVRLVADKVTKDSVESINPKPSTTYSSKSLAQLSDARKDASSSAVNRFDVMDENISVNDEIKALGAPIQNQYTTDQARLAAYYQKLSYLNMHKQLNQLGYYNGRGHSRGIAKGVANGDAQFDFSMGFKSRAKMNAHGYRDNYFDGNSFFNKAANYQQGVYVNPVYQGYYR